MKRDISSLILDLNVNDDEFLGHVENCITLKDDSVLLKRSIYDHINWGRQEVGVFDYLIKLLKDNNTLLPEKLFTLFRNLESKDQINWDEYQKGYQFYPMLLFYMITLGDYDLLNIDDENAYVNFFSLEPENTDWSYIEEYLDADYIQVDYCTIHIILDTIINCVTIKNVKVIRMVKSVSKNTLLIINEKITDDYSFSEDIELFDSLSQKINDMELEFSLINNNYF